MANLLSSNELRKGIVYEDKGETLRVLDYTHRKYGRGQATIRVKVRNVHTGAISEKTYDTSTKLEQADTARRTSQFLYKDESKAHFMDTNDYSQFSIDLEDIQSELLFLLEGQNVVTLFVDGKAVSIEVPKTVELKVVEAASATSGDTVAGANKTVKLETGLELDTPLFVKTGDVLKVNTDSVSYVSRV